MNKDNNEIKKELCFAITNICSNGKYLKSVLNYENLFLNFLNMLNYDDNDLIILILNFLIFICIFLKDEGIIIIKKYSNQLNLINSLTEHSNNSISNVSKNLINNFLNKN
jgi:hypothetical protein